MFSGNTLRNCLPVVVLAATLGSGVTFAQQQEQVASVKVDKPEVTMTNTPEFAFGGAKDKKSPNRREWLEIDVKFEVEGKSESEYIDRLDFKYYIVLDDDKKTMLTADVTHVNIPIGEEVYSSVYLSPGALARYFGKDKARESSVAGFGVEVIHQGVIKGGEAKPAVTASSKWWSSRAGVADVLLPKNKTPFHLLWWDRYADILDQAR